MLGKQFPMLTSKDMEDYLEMQLQHKKIEKPLEMITEESDVYQLSEGKAIRLS